MKSMPRKTNVSTIMVSLNWLEQYADILQEAQSQCFGALLHLQKKYPGDEFISKAISRSLNIMGKLPRHTTGSMPSDGTISMTSGELLSTVTFTEPSRDISTLVVLPTEL